MRCDEFSARFDELLDLRREPLDEPDMAEHAAGCFDCRRTATAVGAAIGALAELRLPGCDTRFDPATDLPLDRILEAIRRDESTECRDESTGRRKSIAEEVDSLAVDSGANTLSASAIPLSATATASAGGDSTPSSSTVSRSPASSFWRGSVFHALIATAATIVLAAYPVWRWNAAPQAVDPSGAIADNGLYIGNPNAPNSNSPNPKAPGNGIDVPPAVAVESDALPSFTELARESRDSYEQLVRDTGRSLGDALAVADVFSSDAPSYGSGAESNDGWLNQFESGLEPLKNSTLGTLDVLRQVVPVDTETRS
jgi:hypothetical protein